MKRFCLSILLFLLLLVIPSTVSAAAPDGAGPWADSVVSTSQGLRKDGTAVLPVRSNAASALGVAENDTTDGNFYSLGFGGTLVLGFDNGISGGTLIVEATNPGYPNEKANVEVSPDGTTWTVAGTVTTDGEVSLPQSVTCAKFVRLTDISNPADFSDTTADAYDVDGVKSTGNNCTVPTPTPTPPCDQNDKECCAGNVTINQSNSTTSVTVVKSVANSGNNKANGNTGGDTAIKTGKAKSKVVVVTTGGNNTANVSGCCGAGSSKNVIKNNGAGSKNTINAH